MSPLQELPKHSGSRNPSVFAALLFSPAHAKMARAAETVAQAEARAADLFIMLDHTGSMGNDCPPEHSEHCGGQDDCHFWSVGDGDPVAFVDALSQIEAAAVVPCSYTIPDAPAGNALDSSLVNVLFQANNGTEFVISRVNDCSSAGGWVYDDPNDPGVLTLCGDTCDAVTAAGIGASVSIAYGCRSVIQ